LVELEGDCGELARADEPEKNELKIKIKMVKEVKTFEL